MTRHSRPLLRAVTGVLAFVTVPAASNAQPAGNAATPPPVKQGVANVVKVTDGGGAAEQVVKWFTDPDPEVRFAAYGGLLALRVNEPTTLAALLEAADKETDIRARGQAFSVADSFAMMPANRRLARDAVFVGKIYEMFAAKEPAKRRGAIFALGGIEAKDAKALESYAKAFKDPDLSVRLAAVRSAAHLLDSAQGSEQAVFDVLSRALVEGFAGDASLRDRAGLALFALGGSEWAAKNETLKTSISLLIRSDNKRDRGIAAVIQRRNDAGAPAGDPQLTARLLTEAVRHPSYWVRAAATDPLFRFPQTLPVDGYQVLLAAVSDPDPAVARDAAMRLSNAWSPNLPNIGWRWAEVNLVIAPPLPSPPATKAPAARPSKLSSDRADDRIVGLTELGDALKRLPPARATLTTSSSMPRIVAMFDDPDPRVREAARTAARASLSPVVAEHQTSRHGAGPTTGPLIRPTTRAATTLPQ